MLQFTIRRLLHAIPILFGVTLIAFMLESDNFNPWIQSAKGYLTHCLNAYDKNPIWTADPKNTPYAGSGLHDARLLQKRRRPDDTTRRRMFLPGS